MALPLIYELLREVLIATGVSFVMKIPDVLTKESKDETTTPDQPTNSNEVVDERALLFDRENPFRMWIEEIIWLIYLHRKNINSTRAGIIFSISSSYRSNRIVEILLDLFDDKLISVMVHADGVRKEVLYDQLAANRLRDYAQQCFQSYFSDVSSSIQASAIHAGMPELVADFISEVFRSRGIRPFNYTVQLFDTPRHVVYSQSNQVDIFGNELIFGRYAIIKYKDNVSNVFTYALVVPEEGDFDSSISSVDSLDWSKIKAMLSKTASLPNCDLTLYPFLFTNLGKMVK